MKTFSLALALSALATTGVSHAAELGDHPAVLATRSVAAINPSTFIVGHPASPTTRAGHANFEHPAVLVARQAAAIDPNTFVVQPPVQVSWTDSSVLERTASLARR